MDTGQTQYTSPFVTEIKPDSSDPAEEPIGCWGEATDPATAVQRPEVLTFQPPVDQPMHVRDSLTKTVPNGQIFLYFPESRCSSRSQESLGNMDIFFQKTPFPKRQKFRVDFPCLRFCIWCFCEVFL